MTPRRLEILDFVREMIAVAGVSPSIRDIARRFEIGVSQAHEAVSALVESGLLERGPDRTRNLRIAAVPDLRAVATDDLAAEMKRRGVRMLEPRRPAVGKYAATCAADTCGESVKIGMLMCRRHWFMLPQELQNGLRRASRQGETVRFQALLATARDIADGLTAEMRERRA